jgi:hypothetical protein
LLASGLVAQPPLVLIVLPALLLIFGVGREARGRVFRAGCIIIQLEHNKKQTQGRSGPALESSFI